MAAVAVVGGCSTPIPIHVSFSQSAQSIESYDDVEVTANVSWPHARNPFTDSSFTGWFESADGTRRLQVEGFCDSDDGSVFRIRFMPSAPGTYRYSVEYHQGGGSCSTWTRCTFQATGGTPARSDPRGSPAPMAFHLGRNRGALLLQRHDGFLAGWMGLLTESAIRDSIQRLHDLEVNRIRVTIAGRTDLLYGESIMTGLNWTTFVTAWPAKEGNDIYHPGFDYTHFYLPYWQKFDRALRFARDRDMIISVILDMNDSRVHPAAGGGKMNSDTFAMRSRASGRIQTSTWGLGRRHRSLPE